MLVGTGIGPSRNLPGLLNIERGGKGESKTGMAHKVQKWGSGSTRFARCCLRYISVHGQQMKSIYHIILNYLIETRAEIDKKDIWVILSIYLFKYRRRKTRPIEPSHTRALNLLWMQTCFFRNGNRRKAKNDKIVLTSFRTRQQQQQQKYWS